VRVFLYDRGYLHAKTISIDSQICSIGSANIDIRSFSINYELNAVFYSEQMRPRERLWTPRHLKSSASVPSR
jgi:cardiolipin synthase